MNKNDLLELYLDYKNNYVSHETFAFYYELSNENALALIKALKSIYESEVING